MELSNKIETTIKLERLTKDTVTLAFLKDGKMLSVGIYNYEDAAKLYPNQPKFSSTNNGVVMSDEGEPFDFDAEYNMFDYGGFISAGEVESILFIGGVVYYQCLDNIVKDISIVYIDRVEFGVMSDGRLMPVGLVPNIDVKDVISITLNEDALIMVSDDNGVVVSRLSGIDVDKVDMFIDKDGDSHFAIYPYTEEKYTELIQGVASAIKLSWDMNTKDELLEESGKLFEGNVDKSMSMGEFSRKVDMCIAGNKTTPTEHHEGIVPTKDIKVGLYVVDYELLPKTLVEYDDTDTLVIQFTLDKDRCILVGEDPHIVVIGTIYDIQRTDGGYVYVGSDRNIYDKAYVYSEELLLNILNDRLIDNLTKEQL